MGMRGMVWYLQNSRSVGDEEGELAAVDVFKERNAKTE